jgi:hypothetical protein
MTPNKKQPVGKKSDSQSPWATAGRAMGEPGAENDADLLRDRLILNRRAALGLPLLKAIQLAIAEDSKDRNRFCEYSTWIF